MLTPANGENNLCNNDTKTSRQGKGIDYQINSYGLILVEQIGFLTVK